MSKTHTCGVNCGFCGEGLKNQLNFSEDVKNEEVEEVTSEEVKEEAKQVKMAKKEKELNQHMD